MKKIGTNYLVLKCIDGKNRVIGKMLVTDNDLSIGIVNGNLEREENSLKEELLKFRAENNKKMSMLEKLDAITSHLEKLNYTIELEPKSSQIQIQGVFEDDSGFVQKKSGSKSAYHQDIERSIQEAISNVPRSMAEKAYTDFLKSYQKKDYNNAIDILFENPPGFISYSNLQRKKIVDSLVAILTERQAEEKEDVFKCLIGFDDGLYSANPELIDKYGSQNKKNFSKKESAGLEIYLAYSFKKRNHKTKAYIKFKHIVESFSIPKVIAMGYLGLFRVCDKSDPDSMSFLSNAADFFRQSGDLVLASQCHAGLAKIKSKISMSEALHNLDISVELAGDNKESFSILKLELFLEAASQRIFLSQYQEALDQLLPVIDQYMELYGAEYPLALAINIAIAAAKQLGLKADIDHLREKLTTVEKNLNNDDYFLRREIADCLDSNDEESLKDLERGCKDKPKELCLIKIIIGSNERQSFEKAIDYLDEAKNIAEKYCMESLIEISSIAIADVFKKNGHDEESLKIYQSILENNPFNYSARKNALELLFKAELWQEAIKLLERQIDILGELPNLLLFYAEALCNVKDDRAYGILIKAKKATENGKVHAKIDDLIASLPVDLINAEPISDGVVNPVSLGEFEKALEELSAFIANDKRMSFWKLDKESNKHKWQSRPEKLAQDLTHTFLKSKFIDQIKIFEEVGAGAGRIDLFLQLSSKLEVVIELKLCGCGYSSTYVKDGLPQIVHYMKSKNTHIGYLLIFDARTRDQGKYFQNMIKYENYNVSPVVVDVRSTVR